MLNSVQSSLLVNVT